MPSTLLRILSFLRITDAHDGVVSLTSLLMVASAVGVILTPGPWSLAALVVGALLYAHKRHLAQSSGVGLKSEIAAVKTGLTRLANKVGVSLNRGEI